MCRCRLFFVAMATFLFLSILFPAGTNGQPVGGEVIPAPDPAPGSWWLYRESGQEVLVTLREATNDRFFADVGGVRKEFTREWNAIDTPSSRPGVWNRVTPHTRTYSFPLWVGKTWGGMVNLHSADGFSRNQRGDFLVQAKAIKIGEVEVPAGKFSAVEIDIIAGITNFRCWYAPVVMRAVKCTHPLRPVELLQYEIRK